MLINVAPDGRGLIPEDYVKRLEEFKAELDRRYGTPLPFSAEAVDNTVIKAEEDHLVDTVVVEEDTREGELIGRFRIVADMPCRKPIIVYEGTTVGHKRICRFPAILTGKIRVEVLESEAEWKLKKFSAFCVEK